MQRKIFSLLALAAIIFGSFSSNAQFRYGPMVGGDMSNLHFKQDNLMTVKKTFGPSAGLVAEMMFPGIGFGVDLGLYYEQRGAKLDLGSREIWASQGYGNETARLHYLVVPFHLRYKYTRLNGFEDILAPFAYVGPSVGFLVAHSKIDCMQYPVGELGLDFGVGVEIKRNWQLSASYTMGMTYAIKDKVLSNYSARNSSWNLRLSYLF